MKIQVFSSDQPLSRFCHSESIEMPWTVTFNYNQMSNETQDTKLLQKLMAKRIKYLEEELEKLRNLPEEEEIFVSASSPEDVYAAFTDKSRAAWDSNESGVEFCSIKLYR